MYFLPLEDVYIMGYARTKLSNDGSRDHIWEHLKPSKEDSTKDPTKVVSNFLKLVSYIARTYDGEEGFLKLNEEIVKGNDKLIL
jgi:glucose-6-phosphate 1-dehydrogenase